MRRKYTGREASIGFVKDGLTEEQAAEVAREGSLSGRIYFSECWAKATLERRQMPLDPAAPIYCDPVWRRQNERASREWYAIEMLRVVDSLVAMLKIDNAPFAAVFAWDLAQLVSEARFLKYMTGNSSKGGRGKGPGTAACSRTAKCRMAGPSDQAVEASPHMGG
jgi:hypothetical protein